MSETHPRPDRLQEGVWAVELMEELLEQTEQTPEQLSARARELRLEATRSDIDGYRDAALALASRYEAAASTRLTTN